LEGISGILHVASPMYRGTNSSDPWNKIVQPARIGTLALLASVRAHGPGVKRIVITGSYAAIAEEDKQPSKDGLVVYTEEDWNIT
jgi:NADPH-dependent methylglyoxal reductase